MDLEQHDPVTGAAQLGALAAEGLAGVGRIHLEVELVHPARHHVALEQELRHVEGVDDVLAGQRQLDVAPGRDVHAATVAGRQVLGVLDGLAVVGEVVELPLELAGDRADLGLRAGRHRVHLVQRLPGDDEQERDDDGRDDRPGELGDVVAVDLGGEDIVTRLAPIADDGPDDQPLDDRRR